MLAGWADQQAAQGRNHAVIQWGNWTAGMLPGDVNMPTCSFPTFATACCKPWLNVSV